jgi:hypothetical protein
LTKTSRQEEDGIRAARNRSLGDRPMLRTVPIAHEPVGPDEHLRPVPGLPGVTVDVSQADQQAAANLDDSGRGAVTSRREPGWRR